jgi:6,7-dimethyl-8-ribityllumazine synthase
MDSIHTQVDDIDTLGQLVKRDTVIVKSRYHNDRTKAQASAIVEHLTRLGANTQNLTIFTNAIPAVLPENRKLIIKGVAREKKTQ